MPCGPAFGSRIKSFVSERHSDTSRPGKHITKMVIPLQNTETSNQRDNFQPIIYLILLSFPVFYLIIVLCNDFDLADALGGDGESKPCKCNRTLLTIKC